MNNTIPTEFGSHYSVCQHCHHTISPAPKDLTQSNLGSYECVVCKRAELELRNIGDGQMFARACAGCNSVIPSGRLAAISGATRCASCQTAADKQLARPKDPKPQVCPRCGGHMVDRDAHQGRTRPFLGCSNFPRCRYTIG